MVPGIGFQGGGGQFTAFLLRDPEHYFLNQYRQKSYPECKGARGAKVSSLEPGSQFQCSGHDDAYGSTYQGQADEQGGHRLELPVTIVVGTVLGPGAYAHEYQHYDVREEIRQGMDGVRYHRGTAPKDSRDELDDDQEHVSGAP